MNTARFHLGIIADGNGRFATQQGYEGLEGYLAGVTHLPQVIAAGFDAGATDISVWLFSCRNWENRTEREIAALIRLLPVGAELLVELGHKYQCRVRRLGRSDRIPGSAGGLDAKLEAETGRYEGRTLTLCLDHHGHDEIVRACQEVVRQGFSPEQVTHEVFESCMDSGGLVPLDLVIRTAGRADMGSFLLWKSTKAPCVAEEGGFPLLSPDRVRELVNAYRTVPPHTSPAPIVQRRRSIKSYLARWALKALGV